MSVNLFPSYITWYIIPIAIALGVAFAIHLMARRVAQLLIRKTPRTPTSDWEPRRQTIVQLVAATISIIAFMVAIMVVIGRFTSGSNVMWVVVGLFGAGVGFGVRPFLSDYVTGITLIFEDNYSIGEKVVLMEVEGVVEDIKLRVTHLRGIDGELFIIPNGDIRVIRNFSRGRFTPVRLTIHIASSDVKPALKQLESLTEEAMSQLKFLIEPWIITADTDVGTTAKLHIVAKARFGKGAMMRPHLMAFIQEKLSETGIELVD